MAEREIPPEIDCLVGKVLKLDERIMTIGTVSGHRLETLYDHSLTRSYNVQVGSDVIITHEGDWVYGHKSVYNDRGKLLVPKVDNGKKPRY